MRISDWSSDVCSSDLRAPEGLQHRVCGRPRDDAVELAVLVGKSDGIVADFRQALDRRFERLEVLFGRVQRGVADEGGLDRDARPEDRHEGHVVKAPEHRERVRHEVAARKSVGYGKSVSVGVNLGGGRIIKEKKLTKQQAENAT